MSPSTGPTQRTRNGVLKRDGYRCQKCGARVGIGTHNIQHRRARGAGGRAAGGPANNPENLLTLCPMTGCHGWVTDHEKEARPFGWAVSLNATVYGPEDVPVLGRDDLGRPQWYRYEGFDRIPIDEAVALRMLTRLWIREEAA